MITDAVAGCNNRRPGFRGLTPTMASALACAGQGLGRLRMREGVGVLARMCARGRRVRVSLREVWVCDVGGDATFHLATVRCLRW